MGEWAGEQGRGGAGREIGQWGRGAEEEQPDRALHQSPGNRPLSF